MSNNKKTRVCLSCDGDGVLDVPNTDGEQSDICLLCNGSGVLTEQFTDLEQLPDSQEEDKFIIKVETSWCVSDVRMRLGEIVEHMTDKEIEEELRQLSKCMHEMCVQSGWDVIDECFKVKGDE